MPATGAARRWRQRVPTRDRSQIDRRAGRADSTNRRQPRESILRQSKRNSRAARNRHGDVTGLLALGIGLVLLPWLLRNSLFGPILQPLRPVGWLLLAGGVLLWLLRAHFQPRVRPPAVAAGLQPAAAAPLPGRRSPVAAVAPAASLADLVKSLPEVPRRMDDPSPRRQRPLDWGPEVFAAIEWRRFEALVEALFAQAGFETRSLSHGADGGVDIWLYSRNQPDGKPVSLVQCKHWTSRPVGVDKVRELRGVMAARDVRRGQFATTSTFTADAIAFGRDNGINLLDVRGLLALIAQRTPDQQQALLDVALEGDYWRPTCVNCGVKMVERLPRNGGSAFWGCADFPRCRTKMAMPRQSS